MNKMAAKRSPSMQAAGNEGVAKPVCHGAYPQPDACPGGLADVFGVVRFPEAATVRCGAGQGVRAEAATSANTIASGPTY